MTGPAPTRRDLLADDPWRFDFLALMRDLERGAPDKPRIGRSQTLAQEIVTLGQDPFLEFPASNVTGYHVVPGRTPALRVRFLGYFGPQGALPLAVTAEAKYWIEARGDDAFARFADIIATRFLQMFYRAWADARPVVQADRPDDDRFRQWLGALVGIGTPALRDRDAIPDAARLEYAGLLGSRVKSAARLVQALRRMLRLDVVLEERIGSWLDFEPGDLTRLGGPRAALGQNSYLGARVFSINDKARLTIRTRSLAEYESFLPGTDRCRALTDFLYFYLGDATEIDVALALPRRELPEVRLGAAGQLGWTTFAAPDRNAGDPDAHVTCATFSVSTLRQIEAEAPANSPAVPPAQERRMP